MEDIYKETISLCPRCAKDSPAYYVERPDGMFLHLDCREHGHFSLQAEKDVEFFKKGYEEDYEKPVKHLSFPVTYRCNIKCPACYTLSNHSGLLPPDRSLITIIETIRSFDGNVSLIGGEPTVREDLMKIIRSAKNVMGRKRLSLCTNALKLANMDYVKQLKENGLDFVYFSLNDIDYEPTRGIYEQKLVALDNCLKASIPVWLQRTISDIEQISSITEVIERFSKAIFSVTIRAVKPFGHYSPQKQVFVSEMLKFLKKENDYTKGVKPFNRHVKLNGKHTKLCSWVWDMKRVDPIDSNYILSDDTFTTYSRGIRQDEALLLKRRKFRQDEMIEGKKSLINNFDY